MNCLICSKLTKDRYCLSCHIDYYQMPTRNRIFLVFKINDESKDIICLSDKIKYFNEFYSLPQDEQNRLTSIAEKLQAKLRMIKVFK